MAWVWTCCPVEPLGVPLYRQLAVYPCEEVRIAVIGVKGVGFPQFS